MHKAACVIHVRYALEMPGSMYSSDTTKSPKMHPADAYNVCNICAFPMLHVASGLRCENASALFGFGNWINGVRMSWCRPVICRRRKCFPKNNFLFFYFYKHKFFDNIQQFATKMVSTYNSTKQA